MGKYLFRGAQLGVFGLIFLLSACKEHGSRPYFMANLVQVNVVKVEVRSAFVESLEAPHVEHLMDNSPLKILWTYLPALVTANGQEGRLLITIEDASIVKAKPAMERMEERYEGNIRVRLQFFDAQGNMVDEGEVTAHRSHDMSTNYGDNEHILKTAWKGMSNAMMFDIDHVLVKRLRENFGSWVL